MSTSVKKSRPNLALLTPLPVKIRGGIGEMSEWIFRVTRSLYAYTQGQRNLCGRDRQFRYSFGCGTKLSRFLSQFFSDRMPLCQSEKSSVYTLLYKSWTGLSISLNTWSSEALFCSAYKLHQNTLFRRPSSTRASCRGRRFTALPQTLYLDLGDLLVLFWGGECGDGTEY